MCAFKRLLYKVSNMKELHYFKSSGDPEITVALAGINKLDWVKAKEHESKDTALQLMKENRFDILPILQTDGSYTNYYKTNIWGNYSIDSIERQQIQQEDKLYFLTHIKDAIVKFAKTDRKYFFLDNHDEIVGLITIGNFNNKHVFLYLYNLIIQLEHALGAFIYKSGLKDSELVLLFEKRKGSRNTEDALRRYKADDVKGFDYDFLEYIFLIDLCYVFQHMNLTSSIGMNDHELKSILERVNEVRKVIAHPNKSLIRDENSINDLYKVIQGIDLVLAKLALAVVK